MCCNILMNDFPPKHMDNFMIFNVDGIFIILKVFRTYISFILEL
jgi:hypothetical protein